MGMKPAQLASVIELLRQNYWVGNEFHHGDCIGADVQAASEADKKGYRIGVHPPLSNKYRGFYHHYDFTYPPAEYLVRDRRIVQETEALIAAPHTAYEIVRSGTWTTVRYARELNRMIYVVKPDGAIEVQNPS